MNEQTDFDVDEKLRKIEEQKERAHDVPDDEVYDSGCLCTDTEKLAFVAEMNAQAEAEDKIIAEMEC